MKIQDMKLKDELRREDIRMDNICFKNKALQKKYDDKIKELRILADSPVNNSAYTWDKTVERYAATIEKVTSFFNVDGMQEYITSCMIKNMERFLKMCSDPEFHIALVGTIKAGKSTLINALLGYEYASTEVTPETAALTKFKKADTNYVRVSFYTEQEWLKLWKNAIDAKAAVFLEEFKSLRADTEKNKWIGNSKRKFECNTKEELIQELSRWTSSKSPVHYFVKEVEVGLSDFDLPEGVVLVDTPGLDDIVEYRSNITRDYIDRANAVLVCVKADALTGQEMNTIYSVFSNVRYHPEKVFIIATQLDTLNRPEENWKLQEKEWLKHLKGKGAFGSEKMAEKNTIPVSAYLYTLLKEYDTYIQDENSDKKWDLESILSKLRIRNIHEKYDWLCDFTNIDKLKRVIRNDIAEHHKEKIREDVESTYFICKEEIQNCIRRIKKEQEDIIKTSEGGIEEIRKKQEEFTRKYEEAKRDKKELEIFIGKLQRMTQERADALERAIKSMER